MKSLQIPLLVTLLLTVFLAGIAQAQEELVFSERFINTTGANAGYDSLGWMALAYDPEGADPEKPVNVSSIDGQPNAVVTGIGGGAGYEICFCDDDLGMVFLWNGGKVVYYALMYDGFTLDRSQQEITRVTWLDRSGNDGEVWEHEVRFMVKIGGQWYVTAAAYDPVPEGRDSWWPAEHTFTTEGSDWHTITLDVEQPWGGLGDTLSGSLPDGNIEAIGFYFYHPPSMGSMRFDEVEIYAEPAEGGGGNGGGGEPQQWAGYDITEQDGKQLVDTASWMGWVDVTGAPWVYPFGLGDYVYLEEAAASDAAGAWVYIPK